MKKILLLIIMLAGVAGHEAAGAREALLDSLDNIVLHRHDYESARREAITLSKIDYENTSDDADRYNILRSLYENYRSYRIDSALIVANMRLEIARRLNDPSKIGSATLNTAEAYAKSGLADKAIAILDTLHTDALADHHLKYRNSIYRHAYDLRTKTSLLAGDKLKALDAYKQLRDDAMKVTTPDSRGRYTLEAELLSDAGLYDEAVAKMEEAASKFDFTNDAAMQYTLGEIYLAAGRRPEAISHLANSAILDITSGTKEYKSLILLASLLFEEGQVERAFHYINCAFEDAEFSKANLRTAEIMDVFPLINRAYTEAEQEASVQTRKFLALVLVLVLVLLVFLIFVVRAFRQKRRMLGVIKEINRQLEEKNGLLKASDALKLNNINILMLAYAKHIARLRDFRKKVYRLFKTGQYDKAMDAVKWDKVENQDITAFHEMFDDAFCTMFPDFVDRVNKCMKEPVVLKNPGRLTPELRVIAMMKLGMTSTDEIADMFHYSPQTVYNLRSTIRTMLKVSKEEFEAYLKTI